MDSDVGDETNPHLVSHRWPASDSSSFYVFVKPIQEYFHEAPEPEPVSFLTTCMEWIQNSIADLCYFLLNAGIYMMLAYAIFYIARFIYSALSRIIKRVLGRKETIQQDSLYEEEMRPRGERMEELRKLIDELIADGSHIKKMNEELLTRLERDLRIARRHLSQLTRIIGERLQRIRPRPLAG